MSHIDQLIQAVRKGDYTSSFAALYPPAQAQEQPQRIVALAQEYQELYGEPKEALRLFSSPGRTEVGGNHTDHQHGRVLAAAVNRDAIALAAPNGEEIIRIKSVGYPEDIIALDELDKRPQEENQAISLIRGICARFEALGYEIGGFNAYTTSDVPGGSGLSSSAAFENLVSTVLNHLFNNGKVDPVTLAQIGQFAENTYFGKPSGLLDQATSSVGGFITIDFADANAPQVQSVNFDFAASEHALCIVDTGGDHGDLTDEYAAVSNEMSNVAAFFEKDVLREVPEKTFVAAIPEVREKTGDRAILRALHFYSDNGRVPRQVKALENDDFSAFKQLVIDSGFSSYMQLQNVYACGKPNQQEVSLALTMSQRILEPAGGAWRVHGGGFAGTIQAFVPNAVLEEYRTAMETLYGEGACQELVIRTIGATEITKD